MQREKKSKRLNTHLLEDFLYFVAVLFKRSLCLKFPGYWSCDNQETSPDTASGEAEPPTVENHWSRPTRTCAPMDGNQSPWRLRFHGPPSLRFLDPWALSGALRACTFNSSSMGSGGLRPTEQPPGSSNRGTACPESLGRAPPSAVTQTLPTNS